MTRGSGLARSRAFRHVARSSWDACRLGCHLACHGSAALSSSQSFVVVFAAVSNLVAMGSSYRATHMSRFPQSSREQNPYNLVCAIYRATSCTSTNHRQLSPRTLCPFQAAMARVHDIRVIETGHFQEYIEGGHRYSRSSLHGVSDERRW